MEVASEIMRGVFQVLMVPVKKQLNYLISYKQYVGDMHTKLKDLDAARVGVESQKKQNRERRLEVPAQVDPWLMEVEQMNKKVADFPSEVIGCFDLKSRHKLGRKASKIFKEIESVMGRCPEIRGTEPQIPLGRIDSIMASSSKPSDDRNDFLSREQNFREAMEALGPNHSSHMVALCGMGGVGKTTMMKKLKEVVVEKKMFNHYVEAVIGEKTDPIAIQQAVAEYLGINLTETTKPARTEQLRKWFTNNSDGGKKKFLVILDDVWQPVDLEDIGLSRLPNQGVDFKVLITSRDQAVCTEMGVKADSVVKVSVLEEAEAQSLFCQIWEPSDDVAHELHTIGEEIVRRCCGLPIAIKTMACTLRSKSKDTWKNALSRLQHHDINTIAPTVFKTSYDNLQDEVTKATFLLCGLFPEDFNIPTEDLLWYGWGLKLFKGVGAIREARYQMNTCIERLIHTNLLMESDVVGCVKLHDLVRAFVLDMFSKDEQASIVNHGSSKPGWPETKNDVRANIKRISLTCKDMSEFPSDLKFPNVLILKLMHGDKSLRFLQNFYEEMGKLQVISYDNMMYPLLSLSLECSNIQVLRLHQCSLVFDLSSIGNLLNLEVLSFAHCGIRNLPLAIRKLKKLKLLDLTGCLNLHIDDGILINLVELEELYMRVDDRKEIRFTNGNRAELAELSNHLSALEVEFFDNNSMPENMLFKKLERFKISVGCSLQGNTGKNMQSFENTLRLVTNKNELLESGMNELFEKTEVLYLEVDGMNHLEEVLVESVVHLPRQAFNNLRVLNVFKCKNLRYLFTVPIANGLMKLERLTVSKCPVLEVLAHSENGEDGAIKFQGLKFLSLYSLPKLIGLCNTANVIELPQLVELILDVIPNFTSIYPEKTSATSSVSSNVSSIQPFFNKEMLIPKLEKLQIWRMDKLKEIWPDQFSSREEVNACMLRKIKVARCDNLVNLFPTNPMSLLGRLEELVVRECGSIEVLFNIDMSCVGEIEEYSSSNLRCIWVYKLGKLRELWRMKGESSSDILIRTFQAVEKIEIEKCERFVNVFTPTVTNSEVRRLVKVSIDGRRLWEESERSIELAQTNQEINVISKAEIISEVNSNIRDVESSIRPMPFLNHLERLGIIGCKDVEVVFEIESSSNSSSNTDFTTTFMIDLVYLFFHPLSTCSLLPTI